MFMKKMLSILTAFAIILTLSACSATKPTSDELNKLPVDSAQPEAPEKDPEPELAQNPLTGEKTLALDAVGTRPVAVTINNVNIAQKVQTGLDKADVVFETEVEGGITRLLAIFSDPTQLADLGTIRSLRVVYADIACGMNAILIHHGIDQDFCAPHIRTIPLTSHNVGSPYAYRDKGNGLAYEHTLYTTGEKIDQLIADKKFSTAGSSDSWLTFNNSDEAIIPAGTAKTITSKFSTASTTKFLFDAEKGKYIRANKSGTPFTDYKNGNQELFTNVFILKTTMSYYSDNYHRKINLTSGTGYYATAGGFEEINWSKGDVSNNFSFTKADGSPLTVNRGNSYVCIMNTNGSASFE